MGVVIYQRLKWNLHVLVHSITFSLMSVPNVLTTNDLNDHYIKQSETRRSLC